MVLMLELGLLYVVRCPTMHSISAMRMSQHRSEFNHIPRFVSIRRVCVFFDQ